jgi:predicted metal-dependent peptidase
VAAAREAYARSNMPSEIARLVDQLTNPRARWEDILRDFVVAIGRDDYSWIHPNRRILASTGDILPGPWSEKIGHIVFSIDTSGSIGKDQLVMFATELMGALELNPMLVTVLFHHTNVYYGCEWRPGDDMIDFSKCKTGGTSHLDVFEKINQLDNPPLAFVGITDLMTEFPKYIPDFPVLWATEKRYSQQPTPFGRVIVIDEER